MDNKNPPEHAQKDWRPECFASHPAIDNAGTAARAVIDFRLHPANFDQIIDILVHSDRGQTNVPGNLLAGVLLVGLKQEFQNVLERPGLHPLGSRHRRSDRSGCRCRSGNRKVFGGNRMPARGSRSDQQEPDSWLCTGRGNRNLQLPDRHSAHLYELIGGG